MGFSSRRLTLLGWAGLLWVFQGCASAAQPTPQASPASPPEGAEAAEPESAPAPEPEGPMTPERALEVVAGIEAEWPHDPEDPLLQPKTLADVEAILKRDQVTLFPAAVAFLETFEGGPDEARDALALHGQIELAWGEAYMLLLEVLLMVNRGLDEKIAAWEAQGTDALSAEDQGRLQVSREVAAQLPRTIEALKLVSFAHVEAGSQRAHEVIEGHPDNYIGYRVSADFYRMIRDWENFDTMVAELEKLNPKSNGLLFLKGAHAVQVDKDIARATRYYRQALEHDPEFVRAQAHLVLIQPSVKDMLVELDALEAKNPAHQLLRWAGDHLRQAEVMGLAAPAGT